VKPTFSPNGLRKRKNAIFPFSEKEQDTPHPAFGHLLPQGEKGKFVEEQEEPIGVSTFFTKKGEIAFCLFCKL
jgi:hypothetical protein